MTDKKFIDLLKYDPRFSLRKTIFKLIDKHGEFKVYVFIQWMEVYRGCDINEFTGKQIEDEQYPLFIEKFLRITQVETELKEFYCDACDGQFSVHREDSEEIGYCPFCGAGDDNIKPLVK